MWECIESVGVVVAVRRSDTQMLIPSRGIWFLEVVAACPTEPEMSIIESPVSNHTEVTGSSEKDKEEEEEEDRQLKPASTLNLLCCDTVLIVLSFLEERDISQSVQFVCRDFGEVCHAPQLWLQFSSRRWSNVPEVALGWDAAERNCEHDWYEYYR